MATLNDMVQEVLSTLRGYVRSQDEATYLVDAVDADDLTWTVGNAERISAGIAECENELVHVDSVDESGSTITVAPYGRGYGGTTAASHSSNVQLTNNPKWPRFTVIQALNNTIAQVSGESLFAVATTSFTFTTGTYQYELPTACQGVVAVRIEDTDGKWLEVNTWRYDSFSNTTDFTSGKTILLPSDLRSGRTVEVRYRKDLTALSAGADVFATITGLPESCKDVIVLGAVWRLLSSVDSTALEVDAVSAQDLDGKTPAGAGGAIARTVFQMFSLRLAEERRKLQNRYPARIHTIGN